MNFVKVGIKCGEESSVEYDDYFHQRYGFKKFKEVLIMNQITSLNQPQIVGVNKFTKQLEQRVLQI